MLTPLREEEFEDLTSQVVRELERTYGEELLYVVAKGSHARAAASPLSDLDLLAFVKDGQPTDSSWLYKTTPVDLAVRPLFAVRDRILTVDGFWPHEVGSLLVHRVYVDRADVQAQLDRWHQEAIADGEKFRAACRILGFYEYYSKVHRAAEAEDPEVLRYAAWEIFFMSAMNVALLNRRFYYNHTTMTEQMARFDLVPEGLLDASRLIFHENLERVAEGALRLFEINLRLAEEHDFSIESRHRVEDIRIA